MLSAVTFSIARRASTFASRGNRIMSACSTPRVTFHASSRQKKIQEDDEKNSTKSGLFGSDFSEWYALPIGIAAAIPAIKFEWYVINEETQLAAVFIAFCVALYSSGGEAIYKLLDERAQTILKDHNDNEDKVINALKLKLDLLKANKNIVEDFEAINTIREQTYAKLSAAGAIKPRHDLKSQIERILNMIVTEEASVTEKAKIALMDEAIATVTTQFVNSKQLKKAALDDAIATIKDGKISGIGPVQASFVKFFKDKATTTAGETSDEADETSQREVLISKMNNVSNMEGFLFEFDSHGIPKMVV